MAYKINFAKRAKKDFEKLKKNKKLLKRVLEIIEDIQKDPYSPQFKFERLKHDLSGFCSKRLDSKNRILYRVVDEEVVVILVSLLGHYE